MSKFESFYIFPVKSQFVKLKQDFICSRDSYDLCSISSSNNEWFINSTGIYNVKDEDNFKIVNIPDDIMSLHFINNFIRNGFTSKYQLNSVSKDDMVYFILSWLGINDNGDNFVLNKAALISEDIYNIYLIIARRFLSTTTPEDLSRYSKFFNLVRIPGKFIDVNAIEKEYKNGTISLDELNSKVSTLEAENKAILSLRR